MLVILVEAGAGGLVAILATRLAAVAKLAAHGAKSIVCVPSWLRSVGVLVGVVAVGLKGDLRKGGALVGRAGLRACGWALCGWGSAGVNLFLVFARGWGARGRPKTRVGASGRFILFDDVVDNGERVGPRAVLPRDGPLRTADFLADLGRQGELEDLGELGLLDLELPAWEASDEGVVGVVHLSEVASE